MPPRHADAFAAYYADDAADAIDARAAAHMPLF